MPKQTGFLTVKLLGATVHGPTLEGAVWKLEHWLRERSGDTKIVVVTGFHGLWVGHQDREYRESVLNRADLFVPDGIAPVWLARLHGARLPERIPGPDLLHAMLARPHDRLYRHFFYGDQPDVLDRLTRHIEDSYPGAAVCGAISPPFRQLDDREEADHVAEINASGADILWVGLGCPKQDWWIARNRNRLTVPVAVGVGAAFRFEAGLVSRAPSWMGKRGLEWVWRLASEPRKMWRRSLWEGPQFIAAALHDALTAAWNDGRDDAPHPR